LLLGYGLPLADDLLNQTQATITLGYLDGMPIVPWPAPTAHQACVVAPDSLPFGDAMFDRVVSQHAIEFLPDATIFLDENQRVLATQGQLIIIVPNRNGMWSWFEHTPFGEGHPLSRTQIRRLLHDAQLSPQRIETGLFVPPINFSGHAILRGCARTIENMGRILRFNIGGVVITEAQKQRYAGIPVRPQERIRRARFNWAAAGSYHQRTGK
jgi:SAM-dependent methyltransferase